MLTDRGNCGAASNREPASQPTSEVIILEEQPPRRSGEQTKTAAAAAGEESIERWSGEVSMEAATAAVGISV